MRQGRSVKNNRAISIDRFVDLCMYFMASVTHRGVKWKGKMVMNLYFSTIKVPTCGARMKYKLEVVQVRDGCRLQV